MSPRAEWRKAVDFAEVAEVLAIPTTLVMAAMFEGGIESGRVLVLYTRDEGSTLIYRVYLERDADGVLRASTVAEPQPGLWEQIVAGMEGES